MCGIAGIIDQDLDRVRAALPTLLSALKHRGPDDEGAYYFSAGPFHCAFGHRRLAILDLSPAGHQPMCNPRTGDAIIYNGEIYNYLELRRELETRGVDFRSKSDTEVILAAFEAWGEACFERLYGMFAVAIYERKNQRILLARDGLGIKPLYFYQTNARFAFASEVRALQHSELLENKTNGRALASLLAYGAIAEPLTIVEGIVSLERGHTLEISLDHRFRVGRPKRFWSLPQKISNNVSAAEAQEHLTELLDVAIRSHLLSDVPVGIFLSSGVDSSAIAAVCSAARDGDIDTFTVGIDGDAALDEGVVARTTARRFGTRHHELRLTSAEVRSLAEKWLASLDQPSVDGLNTFLISKAVRDQGIVVALSGLGGDEVFGGYSTFQEVAWASQWSPVAQAVPSALRRAFAQVMLAGHAPHQRLKGVELAGGSLTIPSLYFRRRRLFSDAELRQLGISMSDGLDENILPVECDSEAPMPDLTPFESVRILETRFYMGNMLLRDADVFAMANGLELRVPLLDRRIVDYVFTLPEKLLRPGKTNKPLLVRAAKVIPLEVTGIPKRGFSLPYVQWMQGVLRPLFQELIETTRRSGLFDAKGVDATWNNLLSGNPMGHARAWLLAVVGSWLKTNAQIPSR